MRKNITLPSHRLIRAATVTREAKKQMISLKHHLTCKLFQVRRANHQGKQRCPYLSKSYVQVALRVQGRRINIWQNCVRGGNSEGWAHWHCGCGHSSPFSVCGNFRCNIPASSVWYFQCVNSELFPMREKTTQVGQCSAGDGGGVVTSLQLTKSFNFTPTATTLAAAGIHGILANLWKGNAHRPRTPILRKLRERSNCVPSLYSPSSKKPCTAGHNQICWAFPIISCNFFDLWIHGFWIGKFPDIYIYMCVALGRSKKCMWYQLSLLRVIQFELQWPQVPIWSTMASKRPSTRGRQALGKLYNRA